MSYDPKKHHRRSIRLKGYDYSQGGFYFITICTKNGAHLFGRIEKGVMQLNEVGRIAEKCWLAIPEHFPQAVLHAFVIMPNHVHGIVEIVGAAGAKNFSPLPDPKRPKGTSQTIGSIVRGFKIGVTKWARANTDIQDVWHRNYYEIIIPDGRVYYRISAYIQNNPANWKSDRFGAG
ncbi:MAG: hypothetical protein IPL49_16455 [Saprospirales bacterium]|nr:hypothetical protein [Saprospirales bacterium]